MNGSDRDLLSESPSTKDRSSGGKNKRENNSSRKSKGSKVGSASPSSGQLGSSGSSSRETPQAVKRKHQKGTNSKGLESEQASSQPQHPRASNNGGAQQGFGSVSSTSAAVKSQSSPVVPSGIVGDPSSNFSVPRDLTTLNWNDLGVLSRSDANQDPSALFSKLAVGWDPDAFVPQKGKSLFLDSVRHSG
jgi:hypothetical protein